MVASSSPLTWRVNVAGPVATTVSVGSTVVDSDCCAGVSVEESDASELIFFESSSQMGDTNEGLGHSVIDL
jgi:hypothetical protein